jgi:hypothetical protein
LQREVSFDMFRGSLMAHTELLLECGNWMSAIQTRLMGSAGLFHPRWPGSPLSSFKSLYDISPMKERLRGRRVV